jgi:hypothetical protein
MRPLVVILLGCSMAGSLQAQSFSSPSVCPGGRCPVEAAPSRAAVPRANLQIDARAIARITNDRDSVRAAGTGTLVDVDAERGLIVTCAHLFREGVGTLRVTFPNRQTFTARLEKIDAGADLAALSIDSPAIDPVALAEKFPERGDPLVSCGYGGDGQLWCNRGQALGYVTTAGGPKLETLEMSGAARLGDSGGPIFDRDQRLVAVLFGTNGRVVDGTYCGRVRRFLAELSPRFRARQPAAPTVEPPPRPGPVANSPPSEQAPPPTTPPQPASPPQPDRLANLEQLVSRLHQGWQGLSAKLDQLNAAAAEARKKAEATAPPPLELPTGGGPTAPDAGPLETVVEPWVSSHLAALLISWGVPGGIAGVAAGAVVWLVMRRAKGRLQAELDRRKPGDADLSSSADPSSGDPSPADPAVVERHHNQYVAYETTALDKAWAAAHAHVGERYPGAVPYLKLVEGVKDQLISGNNDPQLS